MEFIPQVMIVDDDRFIRIAVRELFESKGLEIVPVQNAHECIDALKAGFRGVILLDVMMPEHDGWDTIRMILDNGLFNKVVIVMLTAKDTPDDKMQGLQEYVTDYITKPFEPDELVETVQEYFHLLKICSKGLGE